jgi:hypothetical protein
MVRHKLLIPFVFFVVSCGQTNHSGDKKNVNEQKSSANQFPIQKAIAKYNELLEIKDSYSNISIDTATIKLLSENKILLLDNFEFYRFTIFNGGHYEYNNGQIICLGLVSKSDTNDIRILFPKDYAKSSLNFYDPYLNGKVSDKKDYCTKLSNLINYYTTYQTKNIEYSYLDNNNLLTVISKHTVQSYDIVTKKNISFLEADKVQFTFSGDTLKSFLRVSGK